MAKLVALMKIRPDISLAAAQSLYEEEHVPLVMNLMPMIREYRRNYLARAAAASTGSPDFDVITELWFENRAGYERMLADHENPEVSGAIARDEENCFDRSKTRFFVVEEAETAV